MRTQLNMTSGLFTRVTFKVSVETEFGDAVFVTGNAPILGAVPALLCCPRVLSCCTICRAGSERIGGSGRGEREREVETETVFGAGEQEVARADRDIF